MPLQDASELTDEEKEYLDRNWEAAKKWDSLTDSQKEAKFRIEASKKKSLTKHKIDQYIEDKRAGKDDRAA
ncbi:MAG: hypothetical protein MIL41_00475 [Hyphomicrobiales bacterium]|jgi:uncharacterized protein YdeI (YjbR/CyaY-like superfamily)